MFKQTASLVGTINKLRFFDIEAIPSITFSYEPYQENTEYKTENTEDTLSLEGKFIKFQDYVFYVMNGRKRLIPNNSVKAYAPDGTS
ncbi:MAG: hypothetical protein AB1297_07165, partial [bacterium]